MSDKEGACVCELSLLNGLTDESPYFVEHLNVRTGS
nr:MAG TPA: hypothetical protein [Caudoviricetes sp.]